MGVMQDISQTVNKWYVRCVALPVLVASSANAGISALEAIAQDKNKAGVVWATESKLPCFNGAMIDEAYKRAVPAPHYHPKARLMNYESQWKSRYTHYGFTSNTWNKYYYHSGELSTKLQSLFREPEAMKSFHDEYLRDTKKYGFSKVWLELEGYLVFKLDKASKKVIIDIGAGTAKAVKNL